MEKWVILNGNYDNYAVSDRGRIKNIKTDKLLSLQKNECGYQKIMLCQNNKKACFHVHRLVALYFIDNVNQKPCVNHIDGNKENNYADNLEWCTNAENTEHAQINKLKHDMIPIKLIDLNDNKEYFFQSIRQASVFLHINPAYISRALKRLSKTYLNFRIEKL
jgi:hypothetical protein